MSMLALRDTCQCCLQVFAWSERVAGAGGHAGWEKRLVHDFKVGVHWYCLFTFCTQQ